jgi:hypothetical protein
MSPTGPGEPRPQGKNINGYFGETIEVVEVLRDCVGLAQAHGWKVEDIPVSTNLALSAFTRPGPAAAAASGQSGSHTPRVYISAGIHGDEPAGPLAIRQLLQENRWPADMAFWICPCLNPSGFIHNRRENSDGVDLNRQYLNPRAPETSAHIAWLESQPTFDLCLCLHEDWEAHGFYVYELNPDKVHSLAPEVVDRISRVCPIDRSELIEGRPAKNGIIRPDLDPRTRPQWPEAFYLVTHKTRLSYTLEAPSDFALALRVAALVIGVNTAIEVFRERR